MLVMVIDIRYLAMQSKVCMFRYNPDNQLLRIPFFIIV